MMGYSVLSPGWGRVMQGQLGRGERGGFWKINQNEFFANYVENFDLVVFLHIQPPTFMLKMRKILSAVFEKNDLFYLIIFLDFLQKICFSNVFSLQHPDLYAKNQKDPVSRF